MSQSQLDAFRVVAEQKKVVANARETEWQAARRSLEATQGEVSALITPFVKESIEAYNAWLGKKRLDTERGLYASVDLDSMSVSLFFDIFYPPAEERVNREVVRMTFGEEEQVANFLSKDLAQRLAKAGYKLQVGKAEYDWNM